MPIERTNAIKRARGFLQDLMDPRKTPRIPIVIRKQAYWVLKHFPFDFEIEQITECKKCGKILGKCIK